MILIRTPFRISFLGGGTDFPEWYNKNEGLVISSTINKYSYITIKNLLPIYKFNYRLRYFKTEQLNNINKIKHPAIKIILQKFHKNNSGLDFVYHSDIPGKSGLGGSSAFVVSLINAVHAFNGNILSKKQLAEKSIICEHKYLKENSGSQDQYACSYGGFNKIHFNNNNILLKKLKISETKKKIIEQNSMLIFTGSRFSDPIEKNKKKEILKKSINYREMFELTNNSIDIFENYKNDKFKNEFVRIMRESWKIKKELSKKVSNSKINNLYEYCLKNGAQAGKLLGAGGGGFMYLICKNKKSKLNLKKKLRKTLIFDFKFESDGSKIIYKI